MFILNPFITFRPPRTTAHKRVTGLDVRDARRWFGEACETGELCPGSPFVRPNIDFGSTSNRENGRLCTKNYASAKSHTPGIFTVQCVCRHLKLLVVSVMTKTEGVSTALIVLLSRFEPLPKFAYYDNSCNMARSIVPRTLWINDECAVFWDRFHYAGHICNSIADPESYTECSLHATSGDESINQLWKFSKSHLHFLQPENLMLFLIARSVFLNVRCEVRRSTKKQDITT